MPFTFAQKMYLGFTSKSWPGSSPRDLPISSTALEVAGDYAGSYHIFEMGQHYDVYAADDWEAPQFFAISGLPYKPFVDQLIVKARSAGVTGNIGETITGIVAQETFDCKAGDIAHLVVRSKRKTPDFLIRKTDTLQVILESIGNVTGLSLPDWWLVESKSRSEKIEDYQIREGLEQLVALWFELKDDFPQDVGFGVVVGTTLRPVREIRIHVFIPQSNVSRLDLISYLNTLGPEPKFNRTTLDEILTYLAK